MFIVMYQQPFSQCLQVLMTYTSSIYTGVAFSDNSTNLCDTKNSVNWHAT